MPTESRENTGISVIQRRQLPPDQGRIRTGRPRPPIMPSGSARASRSVPDSPPNAAEPQLTRARRRADATARRCVRNSAARLRGAGDPHLDGSGCRFCRPPGRSPGPGPDTSVTSSTNSNGFRFFRRGRFAFFGLASMSSPPLPRPPPQRVPPGVLLRREAGGSLPARLPRPNTLEPLRSRRSLRHPLGLRYERLHVSQRRSSNGYTRSSSWTMAASHLRPNSLGSC